MVVNRETKVLRTTSPVARRPFPRGGGKGKCQGIENVVKQDQPNHQGLGLRFQGIEVHEDRSESKDQDIPDHSKNHRDLCEFRK